MSQDNPKGMSQDQQEAHARKMNAEADLSAAELEIRVAELRTFKASAESAEMVLKMSRDKEALYNASDAKHHTVRFIGTVNGNTAASAVEKLVSYHRIAPECAITFVIDSGGGDIIAGFHLFDTLLWLRENNHHITTVALGMAASMGGVLLQAGSTRIMAPQSSLLIHEAQFATSGSFGQVEDQVEYVKKLQDRILDILAERSTLSKRQIKTRWMRKNWWLMADEALTLGFVDDIK